MTQTATPATDQVVDDFFTAFGEGDTDRLSGLFSEPTDLRVAGSPEAPWTGNRSTGPEVVEFFEILARELEPRSFEITGRVTEGPDAVAFASCEFQVRSTGKTFRNDFALHLSVDEAGRIARFHMYEDGYAIHVAYQ